MNYKLICLFLIFALSCKKDIKTVPIAPTDKRSVAIIYKGKIEIYKSNLNEFETVPGIDSGVAKIAVDSSFTKIAYKSDSSNIKIVEISSGNLLEEIQNTKYAKDFHFHKATNRFYYLSNNDFIIAQHDSVPFMNNNLTNLTGFSSTSFINAFIIRNTVVVVDANTFHLAYFVNDGTGVVDQFIDTNPSPFDFVVVNEYQKFTWLDVIFHSFGGLHPKLSNHYGDKTTGVYTSFVVEVRNGFKISVDDDNHKITLINSLGNETSKQFDNYYFTGLAFKHPRIQINKRKKSR